jgi:hypothetical protein
VIEHALTELENLMADALSRCRLPTPTDDHHARKRGVLS